MVSGRTGDGGCRAMVNLYWNACCNSLVIGNPAWNGRIRLACCWSRLGVCCPRLGESASSLAPAARTLSEVSEFVRCA